MKGLVTGLGQYQLLFIWEHVCNDNRWYHSNEKNTSEKWLYRSQNDDERGRFSKCQEVFKVSKGFGWENFGRRIISNINLHMSTTPFSKLLITKTIWFILKSDYTVPARCPFLAPIWPSDIPSMVPTSNSWLSAFHYLVFTFILKFLLCFIFTRQNKNAE